MQGNVVIDRVIAKYLGIYNFFMINCFILSSEIRTHSTPSSNAKYDARELIKIMHMSRDICPIIHNNLRCLL